MKATKITLRKKAIKGNRQSLYLDFYPPIINPHTEKATRREFLGLYILDKPKTPIEKQTNKDTLQLAENIKAKRQIEIQSGNFGFLPAKPDSETDFLEFFKSVADSKRGRPTTNWKTVYDYFHAFTNGKLPISNLNEKVCNEFREYLLTSKRQKGNQNEYIRQNTAQTYYHLFKHVLRQAYKHGLIDIDLTTRIKNISKEETQREYLTLDELQKLANTPCSSPTLKRAALFSALTGLRVSDVLKLSWNEVRQNEAGYYLHFIQQKTKSVETLPISEQAVELMGERKNPTDKVFEGLKYSTRLTLKLRVWVLQAGITKDITFHCFRHTYATLQLSAGTDIYTVSKMLGHRNLSTTQIYAKIVDESKREATERIKLDFSSNN